MGCRRLRQKGDLSAPLLPISLPVLSHRPKKDLKAKINDSSAVRAWQVSLHARSKHLDHLKRLWMQMIGCFVYVGRLDHVLQGLE